MHLLLHYNRPDNDYNFSYLTSSPTLQNFHQSSPNTRTSFGVIFRLPFPLNSHSLHPKSPSNPLYDYARDIPPLPLHSNTDHHLFLTSTHPQILPYPHLTPVILPYHLTHPFLITYTPHPQEVFPASPPQNASSPSLFFVHKTPSRISLTSFTYPSLPSKNTPVLDAPAEITNSTPLTIRPFDADVLPILISQAENIPPSPILSHLPFSFPVHPSTPLEPHTKLRIYHTRFEKDVQDWTVLLISETGPLPYPLRSQTLYASSAVYTIDLSQIDIPPNGFLVTAVPLHEGSAHSAQWTPDRGLHVVLAESYPILQTPSEADVMIFYHRFGMAEEDHLSLEAWKLHVWSDEGQYPAVSHIVDAVLHNSVLSFDLTGILFPFGANVHAQPVRTASVDADADVEGWTDVVRCWKAGSVSEMHFVQGDPIPRHAPPESQLLQSHRFFRVRYRRHRANDYNGWDLWTWDEDHPLGCTVAVQSTGEGRAFVDFLIDRAMYAAATRIAFVPRKGGENWHDRDDPVRVWSSDMLEVDGEKAVVTIPPDAHVDHAQIQSRTFITVQASALVLRHLRDMKGLLTAHVESEDAILIRSPVPVSWISPPRRGRLAISNTNVRLCKLDARSVLKSCDDVRTVSGQDLHFRKVRDVSHTETRLVFKERPFQEDFLVENAVVSVPGFHSVPLTWRIEANWDKYLYDGHLGCEYSKQSCIFRCFSPTADTLSVVLYDSPKGDEGRRVVPMRRIPEGCWKVIVTGDLRGRYYKLLAAGENTRLFPGVEVVDPYSRCNTSHAGRGYIFGKECTPIYPRPKICPVEMVVYELHIRDITIDPQSGIVKRGKFLGLAERNTRMAQKCEGVLTTAECRQEAFPGLAEGSDFLDKFSTGLDHIVQMGVNAIQIMPIQDFDNDESDDTAYKWGYMPVHFNSPDGWYATCTKSEARVTELKQLIDAAHRAGLKVIMDVVYNHTAEDTNEFNLDARFSFNGLAPRYYYRTCGNTPVAHTGDSTCARRDPHEPRCGECYSNGSGCGNEFRSEAPMGRKFIIDSLKYWATEYLVDGFRFDLLGLVDLDTITTAVSELQKIDPHIVIYGEPWCGGLTPIRVTGKGSQRWLGFGVFNDDFRNSLRGSPFHLEETFIMDGGRTNGVKSGIVGSVDTFCESPTETINYVECHDNYTLWDHMRYYIRQRTDDIKFTEEDMRRMHRLAAVIVFTSQGIPFIQLGQEMCRTKFDDENSYESPDEINMLRWNTKIQQWTTVQYYRGLILLRRSHPEIFCKRSAKDIRRAITFFEDLELPVPERCIAYQLLGNTEQLLAKLRQSRLQSLEEELVEESLKWSAVVVFMNPTPSETRFLLPGVEEGQVWIQVVDATRAGARDIGGPFVGAIVVEGRSATVLRKASAKDANIAQLDLRLACISDSYASFHGDNALTRFAVGLENSMNPEEIEENKKLANDRLVFERKREEMSSGHFLRLLGKTEADAVAALDAKYGKQKMEGVSTQGQEVE